MTGPRLDPVAQDELLSRLAGIVVAAWPPDTEQAVLDYGRQYAGADVRVPGGVRKPWTPPPDVWEMLHELRDGMHSDSEGTWISARVTVRAERYQVKYKWPSRAT